MFHAIDQQRFAAVHADGALVIDVRDAMEYRAGHVPGARLMPLATLPARLRELPTDGPVYVICQSGGRSAQATMFLRAASVDAWNVDGGTSAWTGAGRPVVTGAAAAEGVLQ